MLTIGLAACQPIPQPFSHVETGDTATLDLPDSGGIVVLDVAEAPPATASALAHAMAHALANRNVPAGTGSGNSQSHFLQGNVEDDGHDAAIVWTLYDPQGDIVDTLRQSIEGTPVAAWARADPSLMRRLAEQVAPQIAGFVQRAVPRENVLPGVAIAPVHGAPGSGNRQLRSALRRHLTALGQHIVDSAGPHDVTVNGTVTVDPPQNGRQRAALDWRVVDAAGVEVGKIAQANPVVAGSLDGDWGGIADVAAQAAAQGIDALVRQVDWQRHKQAASPGKRPVEAAKKPRR